MCKASSPYKKLLTVKKGDIFILKGEPFEVEVSNSTPDKGALSKIFLTSLYVMNNDYNGYCGAHVRNKNRKAIFDRQELIDLLRSGKYVVD